MRLLRAFGRFWYDFIVGDDWRLAVGVGVALALTWALAARTSTNPWWLPVAAVAVLLPLSLWHTVRGRR